MTKQQSIITVKKALLKDLQGVSVLFNAYRIFYQQESDMKLASTFISVRLEKQDSVILIATNSANEHVGFCQLYGSFSSVSAQATWLLNDLFVVETSRRQGIAKQLLEEAKAYAQKTQTKGISLVTAKTNYHAQSLYQSSGYQRQEFFSYFLPLL